MQYRYRETVYTISVIQAVVADGEQIGATQVTLDGSVTTGDAITLVDDRQPHTAEVKVFARQPTVASGSPTQNAI